MRLRPRFMSTNLLPAQVDARALYWMQAVAGVTVTVTRSEEALAILSR